MKNPKRTKQPSELPARAAHETTKLFLIQQYHAQQRDELTWSVNRYRRLCAALQLTEVELAAYIRVTPSAIEGFIRRNRFSPTVELHLTFIERAVMPSSAPSVFPPIP